MSILRFRPRPAEFRAHDRSATGKAFLELIDRRRAAMILFLMVLASLTEGFGVLLLIPIAQSAVPENGASLAGWLGEIPLGLSLALFVAAIVLRSLLQYVIAIRSAALSLGLTEDLRTRVQHALLGAEWRWLSQQRSARMANLVIQQSERVAAHAETVLATVAGLVTAAILTLTASALAPVFTAVAITAGLLVALAASLMRGRSQAEGAIYMELSQRLQSLVDSGIAHLRAAKIAGSENTLQQTFDKAARDVRASEARYLADIARARGVLHVVAASALALLVFVALGWEAVPVVVLVPVLAIFARLVPIAMSLQQARRSWQFVKPAFAQLIDVTEQAARERTDPFPANHAPDLAKGIALRQVTFRAGERTIIEDLSCELPAGSVTLVTGPSGSGKSTLADLLSGLVEPDDGAILVGDTPLQGGVRTAWRSRVAYIEQQPFFWPGSVRDNLTWGRADIGEEAIGEALGKAAAGFVAELPGQTDFPLGDGGAPLSGGEKRRLAFARELLRDPDLLIFDEVFASLEPPLRDHLLATFAQANATVVVISHDPIQGLEPDQVVALEPPTLRS